MHCPSTGPGRFPLVHPSQGHRSPRTSSLLVAAAQVQDNRWRHVRTENWNIMYIINNEKQCSVTY